MASLWIDRVEDRFLTLMDPSRQWLQNPMATFPLANLTSVAVICSAYLALIVIGTAVMKTRPSGIDVRGVQLLYNPVQVFLCAYMCLETAIQAYRHGYSITPCNRFDAAHPVMGNVLYLFYLSKLLDLVDTVFIVLGKKWKQLSVLHVYHHVSVIIVYYILVRVGYDADVYQSVVLNAFVHTVMYLYYFVSAHTRQIWWKKYLTTLQLLQFLLMNATGILAYCRHCPGTPRAVPALYVFYVQTLFWLFVHFYVQAYNLVVPRAAASTKKQA